METQKGSTILLELVGSVLPIKKKKKKKKTMSAHAMIPLSLLTAGEIESAQMKVKILC